MWVQVINALLGVWLMAAPAVLGYDGIGRINSLIVGPIAATFAIIAIWEICRGLGKLNGALGIWLIIAPLILNHGSMVPVVNSFLVGGAMIALAMRTGEGSGDFAGGWRGLVDASKSESSAE